MDDGACAMRFVHDRCSVRVLIMIPSALVPLRESASLPHQRVRVCARVCVCRKTNRIFDSGFNFEKLGIGGLDKEFSTIFRRAFASRLYPGLMREFGMNHVRGMLLYGAPGCGKTLIARKIGEALHAREPKVRVCLCVCVPVCCLPVRACVLVSLLALPLALALDSLSRYSLYLSISLRSLAHTLTTVTPPSPPPTQSH